MNKIIIEYQLKTFFVIDTNYNRLTKITKIFLMNNFEKVFTETKKTTIFDKRQSCCI